MYKNENSPNLKLFELIDMNRGGIYHDFTHGIENRRGFWGYQPYYPPNDEPGFVNEQFIRFVESRDNYLIRRPIYNIATLAEEFNKSLNNLQEYVNKSNNGTKFYRNLRKLQEYLTECGYFNDEGLNEEVKYDLSRSENIKSSVEEITKLANKITNKLKLNTPEYIGSGKHGYAYDVGENTVMKITAEKSEAVEAIKLRGKKMDHLANIYNVLSINFNDQELFIIIQEKLKTNSQIKKDLTRKINRLSYVFNKIFGEDIADVLDFHGAEQQYELNKEEIDGYMDKNPQDAEFFNQLLDIRSELKNIDSKSIEFLNPNNLGYKSDGTLAFFDIGFADLEFTNNKPEELEVSEDGSTKYYGDNNVGGKLFPSYNQKSSEPSIDNNRDANSFIYHENNEKNLQQNVDEDRIKAWIPGSKAVKVKQKCRLGGLNGKSVACNQGDISNLEFSSLDEETKLDTEFVDGWHKYDILHDDEVAGEMEVSNRDKFMVLNKIFINPEHRGMGHAKDAMKILIDYADRNNKIIALTPDNTWGGNKQKLRKWYSSLGFVLNKGSKADYRIQTVMIRYPQNNN
jgi:GNAT superfamily N-acetyltransferase